MDDRTCKHCGQALYEYMVTPTRTVLRALPEWVEPTPSIPWGHWAAYPEGAQPLVCQTVEVGGVTMTLQHEEAV